MEQIREMIPEEFEDDLEEGLGHENIDDYIEDMISQKTDLTSLRERLKTRAFNDPGFLDSLAKLVVKLDLGGKVNEYDAIIGDDTSGRLPSLVLRSVINKKREDEKKKKIDIYFVAGGRNMMEEREKNIDEFIGKKGESVKKALLVTEFISSGGSVARLAEILKNNGIDYDIAAVSVESLLELNSEENTRELAKKVIFGNEGAGGLHAWDNNLSGLTKGGMFSPIREAHASRSEYADQESINKSREDAKIVAEELAKLLK